MSCRSESAILAWRKSRNLVYKDVLLSLILWPDQQTNRLSWRSIVLKMFKCIRYFKKTGRLSWIAIEKVLFPPYLSYRETMAWPMNGQTDKRTNRERDISKYRVALLLLKITISTNCIYIYLFSVYFLIYLHQFKI